MGQITLKEAKVIVNAYEEWEAKWEDMSCSCHINPPCSKCAEEPYDKDDYLAAKQLVDTIESHIQVKEDNLFRCIRESEYTKVICLDTPGAGNACHEYAMGIKDGDINLYNQRISFQNGPIKEKGINGCQNEDLIAIIIDRLEGFQSGEFACDNNEAALEFLKSAQFLLEERTRERKERGVEGRNIK